MRVISTATYLLLPFAALVSSLSISIPSYNKPSAPVLSCHGHPRCWHSRTIALSGRSPSTLLPLMYDHLNSFVSLSSRRYKSRETVLCVLRDGEEGHCVYLELEQGKRDEYTALEIAEAMRRLVDDAGCGSCGVVEMGEGGWLRVDWVDAGSERVGGCRGLRGVGMCA